MAKRKHQDDSASKYSNRPNWYSEMDPHQKAYERSLRHNLVTFCDAKSGTGKTTIASMVGFDELSIGDIQRIVYVRFVDDRYMQEGFLPGTPEEKEKELFRPFLDACEELDISEYQLTQLKNTDQLRLMTDRAMRGTNIKNAFVIIDEAQNARQLSDLLLCLTRIHTATCRVAVLGHSGQQDNKRYWTSPQKKYNAFEAFAYHFSKKMWANVCQLVNDYRGDISRHADNIWESLEEI